MESQFSYFLKYGQERSNLIRLLSSFIEEENPENSISDYVFKIENVFIKYRIDILDLTDQEDFNIFKSYFKALFINNKLDFNSYSTKESEVFILKLKEYLPDFKEFIVQNIENFPFNEEKIHLIKNIDDLKEYYSTIKKTMENITESDS